MNTYQLGLYEKATPAELPWEDRLVAAAECGFDYVEISIDESDARLSRIDWTKSERKALCTAIENAGVPLGSMCLSGHRKYPFGSQDSSVRRRSLEIMDKALTLACDLGLHTIQLAGYDVYYEEGTEDTRKWFAENLSKAVEMASIAGVCLGFETMETPFMDTVEKAMKYVDLIDSPYLGIYPDVGNLTNASLIYGKSVADDIMTGKGHIFAAHMKETVKGAYREIPFSTGTTDYDGALSQLVPQSVRRYVAEMWYTGDEDWKTDLAFASNYIRSKIDAAFEHYAK